MASPYWSGRTHCPARSGVDPWASCQSCRAERRTGSRIRPARAPNEIGEYGGRHTVVPMSAMSTPFASASTEAALTVSSLPWDGPMVTVVYRFMSSMESKPSLEAWTRSLDETSSEKSTMPWVLLL